MRLNTDKDIDEYRTWSEIHGLHNEAVEELLVTLHRRNASIAKLQGERKHLYRALERSDERNEALTEKMKRGGY